MSQSKFDTLSKEDQELWLQAGKAFTEAQKVANVTAAARYQKVVEDAGGTYYVLSQEEIDQFKKKVEPVTQAWREKLGADLYDQSAAYIATLQ
jgi:TRAP-type C4-dicarboxylate transport system substrate-binding protein